MCKRIHTPFFLKFFRPRYISASFKATQRCTSLAGCDSPCPLSVSHFPFFLSHAKRRTRPGSSCACTGWTRRSRTGPSTSSARWPCRPPRPQARRPPRTSPHAWLSTASSVRFSSSRGACVLGVVWCGARVGWRHRRLCCPTRADGKNVGQRLCRPVHRVSSSLSLVCSSWAVSCFASVPPCPPVFGSFAVRGRGERR